MSLFASTTNGERYGVLIEIGSGSASVAIVSSKPHSDSPDIIWSKRETAALRNVDNLKESSKSVLTALINILLDFETNGQLALSQHAPKARITTMQCTVAAPWSYTVTKKIHYESDHTFTVGQELLDKLAKKATTQTEEALAESKVVTDLGLETASKATMHTFLNGYSVQTPLGKEAKKISLVHTSMMVHSYILDTLRDLQKKMFKSAVLEVYTYASVFSCVVRDVIPKHKNVALIDVTYEATEISVLREGVLSYVTHTPFGLYSLARELSAITGDPLTESLRHLYSENIEEYVSTFKKEKQREIEQLFSSYIARLQELLLETGDELAAPRQMLIHSAKNTGSLISEFITMASKQALKMSPVITDVNEALSSFSAEELVAKRDQSLLISAFFYHTGNHCFTIEH